MELSISNIHLSTTNVKATLKPNSSKPDYQTCLKVIHEKYC